MRLWIMIFALCVYVSCAHHPIPSYVDPALVELELRIHAMNLVKWWCTEKDQPSKIYFFVNTNDLRLKDAIDRFYSMIQEMRCPEKSFIQVPLRESELSRIFYKNEEWKILENDDKNVIGYEIQIVDSSVNKMMVEIKCTVWIVQIQKKGDSYFYAGYGTKIEIPSN